MTPPFRSAAVIGLGLIGGSVARDLASRGVHVRGFDAHEDALLAAAADGVVERGPNDSYEALAGCDLVVIAVPVDTALDVLRRAAPHLSQATLITDVGSTKARIVALAETLGLGPRFVGSHPMAGDHRSGWSASRVGLFNEAPVYLCPAAGTDSGAMELADQWWRSIGAST